MKTENMKEVEQRRLAWRCRRGMLELDIVLQRFVQAQFNTLSQEEQRAFDDMLALPDNDFWALISAPQTEHQYAHKSDSTNAVIAKMKMVNPDQNQEGILK